VRAVDPQTWKPRVRAVLEHFADRTPGSFVEEKEFSLVWHYRMADPIFAEWIANELIATLNPALAETEFVAQRGNKIVEVKLLAANKGEVLSRLETGDGDGDNRPPDFLLFAGDDQTDEDLFATLPESAWTIHVGGNGESRARFRLDTPEQVGGLLQRLAASVGKPAPEAHQSAT
jgi:trehalose 6-phosphate synthase/phosphatase